VECSEAGIVVLLAHVKLLTFPLENHWMHKLFGFSFAAIVLVGYLIGHIGDDAISAGFAERAKLAEARLAEMAPRRLKDEQISKMSAVLSSAPPAPVVVVSRFLDPEGKDFADDLASVINQGHWQTARYENWTRADKGIFVATAEGTSQPFPPQIGTLVAALTAANINYKQITISGDDLYRVSPAFQPNVLYLLVGAKP
jgi:hypothetical protein